MWFHLFTFFPFLSISQILLDLSPRRVGWALTFCCHYSVKAIKFPLSTLGDSLYVPIGFYFNLCCFPHLDSFKGRGGEIHRSQLERGINGQQENELTRLLLWIFSSWSRKGSLLCLWCLPQGEDNIPQRKTSRFVRELPILAQMSGLKTVSVKAEWASGWHFICPTCSLH